MVFRFRRIGVQTHIVQRGGENFGRRVQIGDTAGLELGRVGRIENQVPGVVRHFHGTQSLGNLGLVDANRRKAPGPGNQVGVAGVDHLQLGHDRRVQVGRIGNLCFVQFHQQAGVYLRFRKHRPGHHDVVAGIAHDQFGLEGLVVLESLVIDFDARFFLEIGHHVLGDVIRPVIDIQNLFFGRRRCCGRGWSGCYRLFFFSASHQNGRHHAAHNPMFLHHKFLQKIGKIGVQPPTVDGRMEPLYGGREDSRKSPERLPYLSPSAPARRLPGTPGRIQYQYSKCGNGLRSVCLR